MVVAAGHAVQSAKSADKKRGPQIGQISQIRNDEKQLLIVHRPGRVAWRWVNGAMSRKKDLLYALSGIRVSTTTLTSAPVLGARLWEVR